MIQLIASDLDGTLLNEKHQWDEKIIGGVHKVLDSGCQFVVATGRDAFSTQLPDINRDVYLICMNGAQILDPNHKTLFLSTLNKEIVREFAENFTYPFIDYASDQGIFHTCNQEEYEAYQEREVFKMSGNNEWTKEFLNMQRKHMYYVHSVDELVEQNICKINFRISNSEVQSQLNDFLKRYPEICNAPFMESYAEITNKEVNKANAISWLAKSLDISEDKVATYGDGGNDLLMLERFQHSYAPNNASPEAIQAAHQIIGPFEEYSVINHMVESIQ